MKFERIDESRERLVKAFYFALGSYTEQEAKKLDSWREQNIGQLYAHLKHELEEIQRSMKMQNRTYLIHNCIDAVSLSVILLAKVMEDSNLFEEEVLELAELEITSMSGLAILEEGNDYTAEVEIHPSIIITQPPNAKQFIIIEGRKIYLNEEGKKKFKKVEVHWFG